MRQGSLGSWAPFLDYDVSQYPTPPILARKMVDWADVWPGEAVVEPSAGGGNIVRELLRARADVTAIEVDPRWAELLVEQWPSLRVVVGDFFDVMPRPVDLVVSNPPLNAGQGPAHVRRMLDWAPRVVSLLRLADLAGRAHYEQLWSECDLARLAVLAHRPVFVGQGGKTDFCVVDVRRAGAYHGPQRVEHWIERW